MKTDEDKIMGESIDSLIEQNEKLIRKLKSLKEVERENDRLLKENECLRKQLEGKTPQGNSLCEQDKKWLEELLKEYKPHPEYPTHLYEEKFRTVPEYPYSQNWWSIYPPYTILPNFPRDCYGNPVPYCNAADTKLEG